MGMSFKAPAAGYTRKFVITTNAIERFREYGLPKDQNWRKAHDVGDALDLLLVDAIGGKDVVTVHDPQKGGEPCKLVKLENHGGGEVWAVVRDGRFGHRDKQVVTACLDRNGFQANMGGRYVAADQHHDGVKINQPFVSIKQVVAEAAAHEPPPAAPPPAERPKARTPVGDIPLLMRMALEQAGADGMTLTDLHEQLEHEPNSIRGALTRMQARGAVFSVGKDGSRLKRWYLAEHAPAIEERYRSIQAAIAAPDRPRAPAAAIQAQIAAAAIELARPPANPSPASSVAAAAARLGELLVARAVATRAITQAADALTQARADLERIVAETEQAEKALRAAAEGA
jgi:hypothetical protein